MNDGSIAARTAIGATWVIVWRLATRSVGFVSTLVLARLLVPEDFGLVGLATAFAGAVEMFTWIGVQDLLVLRRDPSRTHYDTAFTMSALRGMFMALVLAALASPLAYFMGEPRLTELILVLAFSAALGGLENIGVVDFRRDMRFDREFRLQILPRLIATAVTLGCALAFRSYWALPAGLLCGRATRIAYSYMAHPYRPSLSLAHWRSFLGFSFWTWISAVANVVRERSDSIVVGRSLGVTQVGVYSLGLELAQMPVSELLDPLGRALFSGFAVNTRAGDGNRDAFLRVTGLIALVIMPISVGISAVAAPVVVLLFGPAWTGAVVVAQLLALAGMLRVFGHVSGVLLLATGEPKAQALVTGGGAVIRVALLLALVPIWGLVGAALAGLASVAIEEVLFAVVIRQRLGLRLRRMLAQVWRGLMSSLVMAALLGWLGLGWQRAEGSTTEIVIDLALSIATGCVTYTLVVLAFWLAAGRPDGAEREVLGAIGALWRRHAGRRHEA